MLEFTYNHNMSKNYFFVDGAALLGDIRRVRGALGLSVTNRLSLCLLASYFTGHDFYEFHGGSYSRFVFYFVQDDERLRSAVELPDFTRPGTVSDLRIEYCGKKVKDFEKAREWLEEHSAPNHVKDCLYRSEKAVDTQICCDALQLAATGKLDRLFLYTNDYDFAPLCGALRQLGANINLFRLRSDAVNADLVKEFDAFHVISDDQLRSCFVTANSADEEPSPLP